MAQTGYTPISIYYSSTAAATPTAGNLVAGELAINTADGKLFYKDSAGVVQVIGTKGGVGSSTTTQVLYNSSGLVVGSANMVFDGSTLTTLNSAYTGTLTGGTGVVNLGSGQFYKDASGNIAVGATASTTNAIFEVASANKTQTSGTGQIQAYTTDSAAVNLGGQIVFGGSFSGTTKTTFAGISGRKESGVSGNIAGYMAFWTNKDLVGAIEAMRIDSSGNVLIGTTSATPVSGITVAGQVVLAGSRAFLGTLAGGDSALGGTSGSNFTAMYVNGAVNTTFGLSGQVSLKGASTSGGGTGIAFPSTQSASSDANTLDDYEEGSWTPADASGAGLSFTSVSATYTKIGNTIVARFTLTYPTTASGVQSSIGGLPFTSIGGAYNGGFVSYTTYTSVPSLTIASATSYFYPYTGSGNGITNVALSGAVIRGQLVYTVA